MNRGGRTPRNIDARGQFSPMYDSPASYEHTEDEDFDPRYSQNGHKGSFHEGYHHPPPPRGRRGGMGASPGMMRTPGRHGDMRGDVRRVIKEEPLERPPRHGGHYQSTPRDQRRFRERDYDDYSSPPQHSPRHQPYDRRSRRGGRGGRY